MTREEARERIRQNKAAAEFYAQLVGNYKSVGNELKDIEAFNMAIEALSQPIVCKDYRIDKDHVYCSPELADMVYEALQKHTEDKQWTEETSR